MKKEAGPSLRDFGVNFYGFPPELLVCHSTWGDRLCTAMRGGGDSDNMKKINACMPSLEWVQKMWDTVKDKAWDMNGMRIKLMPSDDSDSEEEDEEQQEDIDDIEAELEKAMVVQSQAVVMEARLRRRKGGKKAAAPDGEMGSDSGSPSSSSDSESENGELDQWASRMAMEEAMDIDDGNAHTEHVADMAALSDIAETLEDQVVIGSPSKHPAPAAQELYSPNKAPMDVSQGNC